MNIKGHHFPDELYTQMCRVVNLCNQFRRESWKNGEDPVQLVDQILVGSEAVQSSVDGTEQLSLSERYWACRVVTDALRTVKDHVTLNPR